MLTELYVFILTSHTYIVDILDLIVLDVVLFNSNQKLIIYATLNQNLFASFLFSYNTFLFIQYFQITYLNLLNLMLIDLVLTIERPLSCQKLAFYMSILFLMYE